MTPTDEIVKHHKLRKMFFTGIFFLIPIGVTYWILEFLVGKAQGYARPFVESVVHLLAPSVAIKLPNWIFTLVSLVLVIIFILLIGGLANFYFGKKILNFVDQLMLKLPLIRSIYGGAKQIIDAFSIQRGGGSFKKVVLLEYPRRGSWVFGFVTNEHVDEAATLLGRPLAAVFVPSTPNPTTGFLLYLDPFELLLVDLEVEEAVKLIVSAGLVFPRHDKNQPITLGESLGLDPPTSST